MCAGILVLDQIKSYFNAPLAPLK